MHRVFLESTGPQISCYHRSSHSWYSQNCQKCHIATSHRLVSWQLMQRLFIQVVTKNLVHSLYRTTQSNANLSATAFISSLEDGNLLFRIPSMNSSRVRSPSTSSSNFLKRSVTRDFLLLWCFKNLLRHSSQSKFFTFSSSCSKNVSR